MRARFAAILIAAGLITVSCGGITDPSQNQVETRSGSFAPGGSSAQAFTAANGGELTVKLTALSPISSSYVGIGWVYQNSDSSCSQNALYTNQFSQLNCTGYFRCPNQQGQLLHRRLRLGRFHPDRELYVDDFASLRPCLRLSPDGRFGFPMAGIEAQIDDLYRLPLAEFTSARNALAKTLKGEEAKRVKALAKPTVVPWAVNQVYWRARATYDRLIASGDRLRAAQIAALEGRPADVRDATEAHRRAIAGAVAEASRVATPGSPANGDALARTFEALSLAAAAPASPGRLTEALEPAGFEAIAGIALSAVASTSSSAARPVAVTAIGGGSVRDQRRARLEEAREHARQQALADAAEKRGAELKRAEAAVARAELEERTTRAAWERAHDALIDARRTVAALKVRPRDDR